MVVVLNHSVFSIGFIADDYWLLTSAKEHGVNFLGSWTGGQGFYRPIVILSLLVNEKAFGTNPLGYHLFNLSLHLANVLLIFSLLGRCERLVRGLRESTPNVSQIPAFLLALLFAIHPANSHDVAWISGRTDLLAGFFTLSAALFGVRSLQSGKRSDRILCTLFVAFALASKEIAVIVPPMFVLFLIHYRISVARYQFTRSQLPGMVWQAIRQCWLLFAAEAGYLTFRLFPAELLSEGVRWSALSPWEAMVFAAKSMYLFVAPIDPMTAFETFAAHPVLWSAVLIVTSAFVLSVFLPAFAREWRATVAALVFLVCAATISVSPYVYQGIISPRLVYVPLALLLVSLTPVLVILEEGFRDRRMKRVQITAVCVFVLVIDAWCYEAAMRAWVQSSQLADRLRDDIVSQLDREEKPVIVLSYPFRVRQMFVFGAASEMLYFGQTREFGRLNDVKMGIQCILSRYRLASAGPVVLPWPSQPDPFTIETKDPSDFLFLDNDGLKNPKGIPLLDVAVGEVLENNVVRVTVVEINSVRRATKLNVNILDPEAYRRSQVFIFQNGRMKRIR
jgi:hypothetical protein